MFCVPRISSEISRNISFFLWQGIEKLKLSRRRNRDKQGPRSSRHRRTAIRESWRRKILRNYSSDLHDSPVVNQILNSTIVLPIFVPTRSDTPANIHAKRLEPEVSDWKRVLVRHGSYGWVKANLEDGDRRLFIDVEFRASALGIWPACICQNE